MLLSKIKSLSRNHAVKVGQDKRRGAENAEGRRDFVTPKQSPNNDVGPSFFPSAFLCVLRVSAFVETVLSAWIRLSAYLEMHCGLKIDSDGVRPSSGAATWQREGHWRSREHLLVGHCCGRGRPHSGVFKQAFTLVALLAVMTVTSVPAQTLLKVGDAFPDLAKFKFDGQLPADMKGKIVLVDFWASWCAPCAKSFPVMDDLQKKYKDRLVILAVSVDTKQSNLEKFLKNHAVTFAVVRDAEHKLVDVVGAEAMPTSFLLDTEGHVRFRHSGFDGEQTKKKYVEEIESLLKDKP